MEGQTHRITIEILRYMSCLISNAILTSSVALSTKFTNATASLTHTSPMIDKQFSYRSVVSYTLNFLQPSYNFNHRNLV